jgi:Interferon-induced transmembrane protein
MTSLPSSLDPTAEVDVETITAALDRKFKSQAIVATVKIDIMLEIYLSSLSIPNPQQMTNVVKQVLGKLQLPEQTVKVFGSQADATTPNWEREVWIEPIFAPVVNNVRPAEPEIDRADLTLVPCPENHLTLAIIATVLGVLPLGLIAIYYSTQVNYKYASGDNSRATNFANNSKSLSIISLSISGVLTGLIFLAILLPVFLGGGFRNKIKQEKIAQKYTQTIMKAKMEEQATANANNNKAGISTTLVPTPPQDSEYQFKGEIFRDLFGFRDNFMITATPKSGNLRSFTGVVYTIENGSTWFVKTDGCVSKSPSYFPPVATLTSGKLACDATSTLASEQAE